MNINWIEADLSPEHLGVEDWERLTGEVVDTLWSGEIEQRRSFSFGARWSATAFHVFFRASQNEPLVVSPEFKVDAKTIGLWDRDVCEIFVAPDAARPERYFEFEVAPTGEWLDVAIEFVDGRRTSDWEYRSGMEVFAKIEDPFSIKMAMKIPWEAFGKRPEIGDVWLGNVFRCVGQDPNRGYLAWRPTMTEKPNFHVPERFGRFVFAGPEREENS